MLGTQHGGRLHQQLFLVPGRILLAHMDEILRPGGLMALKETLVVEQPEPVGDLPLDLKVRCVEGLSLGRHSG
jgi:hypothetical protein